jgi:hypothetical protein
LTDDYCNRTMARIGKVWHEFMGERGPKPPNYGLLSVWEFEFYKAFHLLRDGCALPAPQRPPVSGLTRSEASGFLVTLKSMTAEDYYLATRKLTWEFDRRTNLEKPPISVDLEWADSQRNEEIIWLERLLKPPRPKAEAAGKKIWRDLLRATTYADVRKVCGRWSRLPAVRGAGLTPFPDHVRTNAAQFLAMKRNKRFPKSSFGDDSRIEYLARGMAGIMVSRSPMTGIERLRNMKHSPGGPFWTECEGNQSLPRDRQYCSCWRCRISRGNKLTKTMQTAYDDGFRVLMQIAAETRAPKEWKNRLLRWFSRKA